MAYMNYPFFQPGQPFYPVQPHPTEQMLGQVMPQPSPTSPHPCSSGPVDDRIWVMGETAAQSYLVAANGFVRLWDSTRPVFYEKQADASGKPLPMAVYEYTLRTAEPKMVSPIDYTDQITDLKRRIEALEERRTAPAKKKEVPADE